MFYSKVSNLNHSLETELVFLYHKSITRGYVFKYEPQTYYNLTLSDWSTELFAWYTAFMYNARATYIFM